MMAVQAQYASNAFSPESNKRPRHEPLKQMGLLQQRDHRMENFVFGSDTAHMGKRFGNPAAVVYGQQMFNGGTVFSGDHQSDLTTNASVSRRKRIRDVPMTMIQYQLLTQPFQHSTPAIFPAKTSAFVAGNTTGVQLPQVPSRSLESAGASTSGRPVSISAASQLVSPVTQDLASQLYQESVEIDALVRLQSERLRCEVEEARKRHFQALLPALEQQVVKRLVEKEAELEKEKLRYVELEEKLKQMAAENQLWFNAARNSEAVVSGLRVSLEQALLQSAAQAQEGSGDSEDAQSCCFEVDGKAGRKEDDNVASCRWTCRACGARDVCMLVLPCRHLCLCKDCEPKIDMCPICQSVKDACLHVFTYSN